MKKSVFRINFCSVLVFGLMLGGAQLPADAEELIEPFDNNFIMQDIHAVKEESCTAETRMNFKVFAESQFQLRFNKTPAYLIQTDHGDYAVFIKPFDLAYEDVLPYADPRDDYSRYRLIVMALYPEFAENACLLGFGIFPEGWDGERWIRFKSNKRLEAVLLQDYLKLQNKRIIQR